MKILLKIDQKRIAKIIKRITHHRPGAKDGGENKQFNI